MKTNIKLTESIGDSVAYQEALMGVIEAHAMVEGMAHGENEDSKQHKLADAAANASWEALTATIDCYIARRMGNLLKNL